MLDKLFARDPFEKNLKIKGPITVRRLGARTAPSCTRDLRDACEAGEAAGRAPGGVLGGKGPVWPDGSVSTNLMTRGHGERGRGKASTMGPCNSHIST